MKRKHTEGDLRSHNSIKILHTNDGKLRKNNSNIGNEQERENRETDVRPNVNVDRDNGDDVFYATQNENFLPDHSDRFDQHREIVWRSPGSALRKDRDFHPLFKESYDIHSKISPINNQTRISVDTNSDNDQNNYNHKFINDTKEKDYKYLNNENGKIDESISLLMSTKGSRARGNHKNKTLNNLSRTSSLNKGHILQVRNNKVIDSHSHKNFGGHNVRNSNDKEEERAISDDNKFIHLLTRVNGNFPSLPANEYEEGKEEPKKDFTKCENNTKRDQREGNLDSAAQCEDMISNVNDPDTMANPTTIKTSQFKNENINTRNIEPQGFTDTNEIHDDLDELFANISDEILQKFNQKDDETQIAQQNREQIVSTACRNKEDTKINTDLQDDYDQLFASIPDETLIKMAEKNNNSIDIPKASLPCVKEYKKNIYMKEEKIESAIPVTVKNSSGNDYDKDENEKDKSLKSEDEIFGNDEMEELLLLELDKLEKEDEEGERKRTEKVYETNALARQDMNAIGQEGDIVRSSQMYHNILDMCLHRLQIVKKSVIEGNNAQLLEATYPEKGISTANPRFLSEKKVFSIYLSRDYGCSRIDIGDIVHIVKADILLQDNITIENRQLGMKPSQPSMIINNNPIDFNVDGIDYIIVVAPDILMKPSLMMDSAFCSRKTILREEAYKEEMRPRPLLGQIKHVLFGDLFPLLLGRGKRQYDAGRLSKVYHGSSGNRKKESAVPNKNQMQSSCLEMTHILDKLIDQAMNRKAEDIFDIDFRAQIRRELYVLGKAIINWFSDLQIITIDGITGYIFPFPEDNIGGRNHLIIGTWSVEEPLSAPQLGFKGQMDTILVAKVLNSSRTGFKTMTSVLIPLEFKSGNKSINHRGQVIIYNLLLRYRYNILNNNAGMNRNARIRTIQHDNQRQSLSTINPSQGNILTPKAALFGILIYHDMKNDISDTSLEILSVNGSIYDINALIDARNRAASTLLDARVCRINNSETYKDRNPKLNYEDENQQLEDVHGVNGKEGSISVKSLTLALPDIKINEDYACKKCDFSKVCVIYHQIHSLAREIDLRENNLTDKTFNQAFSENLSKNNKVLASYNSLSLIQASYMSKWDKLIANESHKGYSIKPWWLDKGRARELSTRDCIAGLTIEKMGIENDVLTYTFSLCERKKISKETSDLLLTDLDSLSSRSRRASLSDLAWKAGDHVQISTESFRRSTSTRNTNTTSEEEDLCETYENFNVLEGKLLQIHENSITISSANVLRLPGFHEEDHWMSIEHFIEKRSALLAVRSNSLKQSKNLYCSSQDKQGSLRGILQCIIFRIDRAGHMSSSKYMRTNLLNFVMKENIRSQENPSDTGKSLEQASLVTPETERLKRLRKLVLENEEPTFVETYSMEQDLSPNLPSSIFYEYRDLDFDQKNAVQQALRAKDYLCIHGLPGTGKTKTISHLVRQFIYRGKSVLVTAFTHNAVDNVIDKVKQASRGTKIDIIRLLKERDDLKQATNVPIENLISVDGNDISSQSQGHSQRGQSKASVNGAFDTPKIKDRYEFLKRVFGGNYDQVNNCRISKSSNCEERGGLGFVLGITCLGMLTDAIFLNYIKKYHSFDVVIVDEAGQLPEPYCLGALLVAKKIILVGDHFQLPPLAKGSIKSLREEFAVSLFERFCKLYPKHVVTLSHQYRMNKELLNVCGKYIYKKTNFPLGRKFNLLEALDRYCLFTFFDKEYNKSQDDPTKNRLEFPEHLNEPFPFHCCEIWNCGKHETSSIAGSDLYTQGVNDCWIDRLSSIQSSIVFVATDALCEKVGEDVKYSSTTADLEARIVKEITSLIFHMIEFQEKKLFYQDAGGTQQTDRQSKYINNQFIAQEKLRSSESTPLSSTTGPDKFCTCHHKDKGSKCFDCQARDMIKEREIAIISPFQAQVRYIKNMILYGGCSRLRSKNNSEGNNKDKDVKGCNLHKSESTRYNNALNVGEKERKTFAEKVAKCLEIDTVDRFQGKDKDIVIISCVDSGNQVHEILLDWRRINVMISRAKEKLILVGCLRTLTTSSVMRKLIKHCVANGAIVSVPPQQIQSVITGYQVACTKPPILD